MTTETLAASGAPGGGEGGAPNSPGGGGPGAGGGAPPSTPVSSAPATGEGGAAPAGSDALTGTLASGAIADKTPSSPPTWPEDWRTKLAGDDKSYLKTLERFADPAAYAKHARELQAKLSSGKVANPPPAADAPPEEIATWRKENGLPEAPTGYLEKLALPNGLVLGEADKPIVGRFAERAHALNMPPEQFNGMVSQYYEMLDAQTAQVQESDHKHKIEAQDALNKEWGPEFRANINSVQSLLSQAPDDVKDRLFAGRTADGRIIGNDPSVLRWLAGLAREINPMGSLMPAGTSDVMKSGENRITEITKMMGDYSSPYWKDGGKLQEEYRSLIEAREKMKARG